MNAAIGAPTDLTDNFATDDQPKWGETGGHPGHAGVAPVAAPAYHRGRAPRPRDLHELPAVGQASACLIVRSL